MEININNNHQASSHLVDQLHESHSDTKILVKALLHLKQGLLNGLPNVFLCLSLDFDQFKCKISVSNKEMLEKTSMNTKIAEHHDLFQLQLHSFKT